MIDKIKSHFNKNYNLVFWILFGPAILCTLLGIHELYTKYYGLLTKENHLQFFLRFFFPISVGLLVASLEKRQRKRREILAKKIQEYLEN
jgi:uncharacterized membrane protein YkvI